ncbi:Uncharacterised protein [Klebsiella pneumoniae]|nr:Uncharacterised protein [Klebsiella pneumoniae]
MMNMLKYQSGHYADSSSSGDDDRRIDQITVMDKRNGVIAHGKGFDHCRQLHINPGV